MALIVQDNTGTVSGADTYRSLADAQTYWSNRGMNTEDYDDDVLEQKLRLAFDYVNSKWRYKGERLTDAQESEFPRANLVDWSSKTISGVPTRVKDAQCDLAFAALTDSTLFQDLDRGGQIKSESVGPISVTYMDGAPAGKTYTAACAKLAPYIRDSKVAGTPFFGTDADADTDAIFDIGMNDNPLAGPAPEIELE